MGETETCCWALLSLDKVNGRPPPLRDETCEVMWFRKPASRRSPSLIAPQ
jgi:hypothetical protein